jgi:ferric-dicitrate binding protein FerR (iron transport regulator)
VDSNRFQIEELLQKASLTEEEAQWLFEYLQQSDTPELRALLLERFAEELSPPNPVTLPQDISQKMLTEIRQATRTAEAPVTKPSYVLARMAAAVVLLVLVAAAFWWYYPAKSPEQPLAISKPPVTDVAAPADSRATITLANGQQIILDSNLNGILASEGAVRIERADDGAITYKGAFTETVYNTLYNPRGSKPVSLTLSDGSRVWLNSESSLRYPVAFSGKQRPVAITGEAYFEVVKNTAMPFRVSIAGKGTVDVLGTHFNVNSYPDESDTRITLLEGSVRVAVLAGPPILIQPGQQAVYDNTKQSGTTIAVRNGVNMEAVMAWKNGFFHFDQADLYTVMRQLARWYNIEVKYEGKIPARTFGGEMQRDLNLSEVLKLLEKNKVHFRIENDQLLVRP